MKRSELKAIIKECIREAEDPKAPHLTKAMRADLVMAGDDIEVDGSIDQKTAEMIMGWLKGYGYPRLPDAEEKCAKWIRDKLRIGGMSENRKMIKQAIKMTHGGK